MARKMIVNISIRNDIAELPIQFYAVEVPTGDEKPRSLTSSLFSAVEPVTMDEIAQVFELHARRFRELATMEAEAEAKPAEEKPRNPILVLPGNDSIN